MLQLFSNVSITIDDREAARSLADIKGGIKNAKRYAINRTLRTQKSKVSTKIRKKVNIHKRDIDPHIKLRYPTKTDVSGSLVIEESKRIGIEKFGAKPYSRDADRDEGGLVYSIDKGKPKVYLPRAFIVVSKGGAAFQRAARNRFERRSVNRLNIKRIRGPSAWGVFVRHKMRRATIEETKLLLQKNLARRVEYLLLKHNGEL